LANYFCYDWIMPTGVPEPHLSAWRAVLNAHAVLVDRIEHELTLANLPPLSWYDVLWAVRRAPGRRIRMAQLADSLTLSRGGLTKLADRLEREGLLRREPADDDGRGFYATITDKGVALLRQMWAVYSRVLRQSFAASIDECEAQVIASALARTERATRAGTSRRTPAE
jgi:DNA-binding MarR family transcriptional regulator